MLNKIKKIIYSRVWIILESIIVISIGVVTFESILNMINKPDSFMNFLGFVFILMFIYGMWVYIHYRVYLNLIPNNKTKDN